MTTPATLHLRERQSRLCRLAPDEVRHLLAHHSAHLDLAPAPGRHTWKVTPGGIAGVILTPRRRIVIVPKVPLGHLLHLLDEAPPPSLLTDHVLPVAAGDLLDLLAVRLADLLVARTAAGLHRGYRETAHQGPYLAGPVDLPAQLRQLPGRRDQLCSREDAFTTDLPCNQVPRTLAGHLAGSPLITPAARARLAQALAGLAHVRTVPLTPATLAASAAAPIPAGYRSLIDLCLLLAESLAPGMEAGPAASAAVLVSLERWFEQYLSRTVEEALAGDPGVQVLVQRSQVVSPPATAGPTVTLRPDLTLFRDGRAVLLVDAKWKTLSSAGPESHDLYQALAYATLLGAGQTVLVYPGSGPPRAYTFLHSPVQLWAWALDVSGPPGRCRRGRQRLGRALQRWSWERQPGRITP